MKLIHMLKASYWAFRLAMLLALALTLSAQEAKPIPAEYITIITALNNHIQSVQSEAVKAVAMMESTICADAKIPRISCLVDWQHGTVGTKSLAPKPVPEVPKTTANIQQQSSADSQNIVANGDVAVKK